MNSSSTMSSTRAMVSLMYSALELFWLIYSQDIILYTMLDSYYHVYSTRAPGIGFADFYMEFKINLGPFHLYLLIQFIIKAHWNSILQFN